MGGTDNMLSDRSQHPTTEPGPPVTRYDDQIAPAVSREVDQAIGCGPDENMRRALSDIELRQSFGQ